jgi:hypothetical protein
MGLSNVVGVFSRYFIVGFFLPAFFVLVVVAHALSAAFLPNVYNEASSAAQIAIIGGTALLTGLLLVGLHYPVLRLFEGYPLQMHRDRFPIKQVHTFLQGGQQRRFDRLKAKTELTNAELKDRWNFDREFPRDALGGLLPTAFGNAIRAFERHSLIRWELNGIAVWPYVENLLSSQEAQVLADAKGDVAFFINMSLLLPVGGFALGADRLVHDSTLSILLCLIPFALGALAYHWAIGAAIRWGETVRASIDLHRRELYARLGLRTPKNFTDERQLAKCLSATLLAGDPLGDQFAERPASEHRPAYTLDVPSSAHQVKIEVSDAGI